MAVFAINPPKSMSSIPTTSPAAPAFPKNSGKSNAELVLIHGSITYVAATLGRLGRRTTVHCVAIHSGYSPGLSYLNNAGKAALGKLAGELSCALSYGEWLSSLNSKRKKFNRDEKKLLGTALKRLWVLEQRIAEVFRNEKFDLRIKGLDREAREVIANSHEEAALSLPVPKAAPNHGKKREDENGPSLLTKAKRKASDSADPAHPFLPEISDLEAKVCAKAVKGSAPVEDSSGGVLRPISTAPFAPITNVPQPDLAAG